MLNSDLGPSQSCLPVIAVFCVCVSVIATGMPVAGRGHRCAYLF
jgi:hypothetical protein